MYDRRGTLFKLAWLAVPIVAIYKLDKEKMQSIVSLS
jgi:hypothetical protein